MANPIPSMHARYSQQVELALLRPAGRQSHSLDRHVPGLADSRIPRTGFQRFKRCSKLSIAECESQRAIDRRVMEFLALIIIGQRGRNGIARSGQRSLLSLASKPLDQIVRVAIGGRSVEGDLADT